MVWDISLGDWAGPRKEPTAMTVRYATWGLCEEDFEGISLQEFETAESRIPLLSEYHEGKRKLLIMYIVIAKEVYLMDKLYS